jgi:hypothetical protein
VVILYCNYSRFVSLVSSYDRAATRTYTVLHVLMSLQKRILLVLLSCCSSIDYRKNKVIKETH